MTIQQLLEQPVDTSFYDARLKVLGEIDTVNNFVRRFTKNYYIYTEQHDIDYAQLKDNWQHFDNVLISVWKRTYKTSFMNNDGYMRLILATIRHSFTANGVLKVKPF